MRNPTLLLGCLTFIPILSSVSTCPAQQSNWVQIKTKNSPPPRLGQGLAYDSVRGRTVLFGGINGAGPVSDTWEYDGDNWTKRTPKTVPTVRGYHAMVYHLARLRTVLFACSETWTWDGNDWTQLRPKTVPPLRCYFSMTYDAARQRTVLFGGIGTGPTLLNDTWEWDGNDWTQIKTTKSPAARYGHGMAYDSTRRRIVLFGGISATTNQSVNDTWEYDGKSWVNVALKTQPRRRYWSGMAYDMTRRRTVLFGGMADNFTWEYDGADWTKTTSFPRVRHRWGNELMVYDLRRNRIVLFGGSEFGQQYLNETWEYISSPPLTGSPSRVSIATGGTHTLSLNAGVSNARRLYWVFGSVTGTSPGVTLTSRVRSVSIPLNLDFWTDVTIGLANSALLTKTRGALDGSGKGSATFNVPKITNQSAVGVKFYHAYLVYDAQGNFHMASNPVELVLVK